MTLVRKNLMVDAERLRALAQSRGTSESAAVREAVEHALAADAVMAAIRELHHLGAFADDRWPPGAEPEARDAGAGRAPGQGQAVDRSGASKP